MFFLPENQLVNTRNTQSALNTKPYNNLLRYIYYDIWTPNEIPGELSRENTIFSHVITVTMAT